MALKAETLKANELLSTLTEEQIAAIETLSKNDETAVIGKAVGDLHQKYDDDVKELSGFDKNQSEKSYDYVKRVMGEFKTNAESSSVYAEKVKEHEATIEELKKSIEDGKGDESIRKELKKAQSDLSALQQKADIDSKSWEEQKGLLEKENLNIKLGYAFSSTASELQFKPEYPEAVTKVLLDNAKATILAEYKPEWGEDGKMYFTKDGEIARNAEKGLDPYTLTDLMSSRLADSLDISKKSGTGTRQPAPTNTVGIAGAKTKVEANDAIRKELLSRGLTADSPEFATEQTKLYKENGVQDLPMKE